ncbi:hypothetical protein [Clostridium sulfidigenes]|uniref:hypothetical protein n=1 Tax=Clostridium sulfidigenes TaxID=318464 RepID=UPI003F894C00
MYDMSKLNEVLEYLRNRYDLYCLDLLCEDLEIMEIDLNKSLVYVKNISSNNISEVMIYIFTKFKIHKVTFELMDNWTSTFTIDIFDKCDMTNVRYERSSNEQCRLKFILKEEEEFNPLKENNSFKKTSYAIIKSIVKYINQ